MNSLTANRLTWCAGFTLIELLLVMLISSILILGISSAYRQAHSVWSSVEDKRPIYHNARLITETLRQELSCLYFPVAPGGNNSTDDGKPLKPISIETTQLSFYTLAPSWKGDIESSRIAKVRYYFTKDRDSDESILQRFEQPCAGEKPIGKESSDVIAKGLSDFSVSAIEGEDKDGGEKNTPPKAVRISLKWAATEDIPGVNFQTTIMIPCQVALEPTERGPASGAAPPSAPF